MAFESDVAKDIVIEAVFNYHIFQVDDVWLERVTEMAKLHDRGY
jgi:hypothetical protein